MSILPSLRVPVIARGVVLALAAIVWPVSSRSNEPAVAGRDWRIVEVAGKSVDAGTIRFDAHRVSGRAACNSFFAMLATIPGGVSVGAIGSTRMFCAGKMELERETLAQLGNVTRIERRGAGIALTADDGKILLGLASK